MSSRAWEKRRSRRRAGEPVLGKTSLSAFATTNLDEMLRQSGVGQLIIAGVATSGTVLSTTRWAVDTGYQVTVCADACADPDPRKRRAARRERLPEQLARAVAHRPGAARGADQRAEQLTDRAR